MSKLRVRIHKSFDDQQDPPHIYASIRAITKSGARKRTQPVRQELIPVSDRPDRAKSIEVQPGHYYVEAVLPSGEFLSEDVTIASGQTRDVVFKPDASPHEWLAWQQLSGNLPSSGTPKDKDESLPFSFGIEAGYRGTHNSKLRWARYIQTDPEDLLPGSPPTPEVVVKAPIGWLKTPHKSLLSRNPSQVWEFLGGLKSTSPGELTKTLNGGNSSSPVKPAVFDDDHGVFRVNSSSGSASGVVVLKTKPQNPTYLVVPRKASLELLVLPLPWTVAQTNRKADIEVAIQEPTEPKGFCSSAIARDEKFGMLLGYLSSGSLPAVRQIAETAREMLFFKFDNPYAAAAGAYAMVGTAHEAKAKDWHEWVQNLMNYFEWIPDGAIQWGQLMMRMRRNSADISQAVQAFKLAYNRGLPFYSMGMRWLLEGLDWAAHKDPEAAKMADHVRHIAWRTNYYQPFTTLRIGGATDV